MSEKAGKILVVGGAGLVGNALLRAWRQRGADVFASTFRTGSSGFRRLDMRDRKAVRDLLRELRPEIVALPAANPYVDYCELHPEETRRINVEGTLNVAHECKESGSRMIFFSSDYVFDGSKEEYAEKDKTCPINEYGRQKAEAEAEVLRVDAQNLVIRTSGAYGWQWETKNFVLQVRSKLQAQEPLKVDSEVIYNPTYVENLAEVTVELASSGRGGIFQVVGADRIRRFDFAREAARSFGLDESLLVPIPSREFNPPARRPKQSSLSTEKVRAAVRTPLWGVRQGLSHMVSFESEWRCEFRSRFSPPPQPSSVS